MQLTLPSQLEDFVRSQVRSGRYLDEQEVVREALRQMRAIVRAEEDPNVGGVVRDAIGIATQAQRDIIGLIQNADREQTVFGEVVGHATSLANTAIDTVRRVPGAREVESIMRAPMEQVTTAAQVGELQARAMRQNLETTAKALGVLTALLERVNSASRTVNSVIAPPPKNDR